MKTNTTIATTDAKRIAKRLLNHWKHKFDVAETETLFTIFMPDAEVKLFAEPEQLKIEIQTAREDYTLLEKVVLDHVNRMAQQEFEVIWSHHN